jgi:predicted nucleic acid-binding protein
MGCGKRSEQRPQIHGVRLDSHNVQFVSIRCSVQACRDPNDDKFLDVAVNGGADVLITGDADLLALNPYEGIPILTAADYLTKIGG